MVPIKVLVQTVFIYVLISVVGASEEIELFRSNEGSMVSFGPQKLETMHISCNAPGKTVTDIFPRLETKFSLKEILFVRCQLPAIPLVDLFERLNINATAIEYLHLVITDDSYELPPANYTAGLKIQTLSIASDSPRLFRYNRDFFEPLSNLNTLDVDGQGLELPYLPASQLEELSLGGVTFSSWGNCASLKKLSVGGKLLKMPSAWPKNCSKLTELEIKDMSPDTVNQLMRNVSANFGNLRSLTIKDCDLVELSADITNATKNLQYLDLSWNRLSDDECAKFPDLRNCTTVLLNNNELTSACLKDIVPKLPSLRILNLDGNNFAPLFSPPIKKVIERLHYINELHMDDMAMEPHCLEGLHFNELNTLSLASYEPVKHFRINGLPGTSASNLTVNLHRRDILRTVTDEITESWFEKNNRTLLIVSSAEYVDCDCENAELVYALKKRRFEMPSAKCKNTGNYLIDEPLENMECISILLGDCTARWRVKDQPWTKLDCANLHVKEFNWQSVLYGVPNPISLNASGNFLTSLQGAVFPDSVEWVDLRNNHISRLTGGELGQLFGSNRRVWLGGNPILCDCLNAALLDSLQEHRQQVVDYESVHCVDSGTPLHKAVAIVRDFCSVSGPCQLIQELKNHP